MDDNTRPSHETNPTHGEEPSRGETTRLALIEAGLKLFGEHGFTATSTRTLCREAQTNIASIPYYFESKRGLYCAVIRHITERVEASLGESAQALHERIAAKSASDPDHAYGALASLMDALASLLVASEEPRAWAQLIMREQANPSEAFDILYNEQIQPLQALFTELMAVVLGRSAEETEVTLRAHALFGQLIGFVVSRESLLRHLGVAQLSSAHISQIHQVLLLHLEACLYYQPIARTGASG